MTFYTSNLLFGINEIAQRRHFKDVSSMNNRIIENWNSLVVPDDTVYILGGVGEFEFLLSLNGEKKLMFTESERLFYEKYISEVTTNIHDMYNEEMFEVYVRNMFYISKVLYQKSILIKDYSGELIRLSTDKNSIKSSKQFVVEGNISDYQRMFNNGINADIFVNGMFPLSEVDVQRCIRNQNRLV